MATLQCAGNRRTEMHNLKPIKGVGWGISTISNAVWGGVLLRDVLLEAGVVCADTDNRHVAFEGLDWIADKRAGYGSSIPITKAMNSSEEVLLAWEMNGVSLPPDHGYPLRAIVPGYIAARSTKWLGRITVQVEETDNFYQQFDYKMFPPFVDWNNVEKWWHLSRPVLEMNVQSCICQPQEKEVITGKDGMYTIKGYAISGGGRRIERVDLSLDGGSTWVVVGLTRGEDKGYRNCYWSWTFWEKTVPIIDIGPTLVCRCWDSGSNTQPEGILPLWNLRGILNNAWHRINVIVNKSKL